MKEILVVLPPVFREIVLELKGTIWMEELRLRRGQPLSVVCEKGELFLNTPLVTGEHLEHLLERGCDYSVHTVQSQIARGFITLEGGHRMGLCGTVVEEKGEITTLRQLSSVSIRFAREVQGIAEKVLPQLVEDLKLQNTLVLAPPALGKTTFLRDLIRMISNGSTIPPCRVGVVDERGEIASLHQGNPRFDVGRRTDVLEGCSKAEGMMMLLRSMNPQVLAVDEITAQEDIVALLQGQGCGVILLATAHGTNRQDLEKRPLYRQLLQEGIFQRLVTIEEKGGRRRYAVEVL